MNSQANSVHLEISMDLYANTPLQATMQALNVALGFFKTRGDVTSVIDKLANLKERKYLVHKENHGALEVH